MTDWSRLLRSWRCRVKVAPVGSFLDKPFGGRVEKRKSGWFLRAFYDTPWRKVTEEEAAVSLAAYNFACVKRARRVLPLP